ncbi:MAG: hypothetical protein ABI729_04050, partial [Chitinophagales bacterium]
MKKLLLNATTSLFVLLVNTEVKAQDFKDRFFHNIGYTVLLDAFGLPSFSDVDVNVNTVDKVTGFALFTYIYEPRLNIFELNENTSIDIHAIPALGLTYSTNNNTSYIGSFSLPVLAGINFGNVSTYTTRKNVGFGMGIGVEYFNGGLFRVDG